MAQLLKALLFEGFTKKSKIIKLNFDFSEEIDELPYKTIVNSGILPYNDELLY